MASKTRATTKTTITEPEPIDGELVDDAAVDDPEGAPDNVIALREGTGTTTDIATPDAGGKLSTPQKVGVGVGLAGGAGLMAFGVYKLGQRMGWWGASSIVLDDDSSKGGSTPKKDDGKPIPSGPKAGIRALGKPPNVSGDPQGYNTQRYPHPGAVRLTMTALGYKVEYSAETLVPNNQPNLEVRKFQHEWNRVIRGLDSGKVKFPSPVDDPSKLRFFRGLLDEDGIPGKNTLNAMEIAVNNQLKNKMSWRNLVGQA